MNKRITISVFMISSFLLFYSCQEKKPNKEKSQISIENDVELNETEPNIYRITTTQFENHEMELGVVGVGNSQKGISAAGYIEVPNEGKAEVRSFIGGYLQSSTLLPGDYVKKGQFLISLENLEYIQLQQDFLQVKEELTYLKSVYERQKVLADEKISSLNSKQQAESEYNIVLANFEGLKRKLQMININPEKLQPKNISSSINLYAPIEGFITTVNAVKGMYAEPTDIIYEIINTEHLHIELKVYEKDILKIHKGQKITFQIPEADNEVYSGEVYLVGKTIDESDRTVTVHCHIIGEENIPAVVGMYIEAEVYFEYRNGFCLPTGAFIHENDEYFVFINQSETEDGYVFEKIRVDTGKVNEDCIEITSASQLALKGKMVLLEGASDL